MTNAACLANRLATIHKDMCALSEAIRSAASDVEKGRATIAASIESRLTDDLETVAFRLERMANAESIGVLGFKVYDAAITIAAAFLHQRYHCRRNRAQFIAHGAAMSALTERGVYQVLIAKRKEAKAAAQAETAPTVESLEAELTQLEERRAELSAIMQDDSTSDADFDAANAEAITVGKAMMQTRSDIAVARNAEVVEAKKAQAVEPAPTVITVSFRGLPHTYTATHTTIENNLLMVWNGEDFIMCFPSNLAHVVEPESPCESAEPATQADPLTSESDSVREPVSAPVEQLFTLSFAHKPEGASRFERVIKQETVKAETIAGAIEQIVATHNNVNRSNIMLVKREPVPAVEREAVCPKTGHTYKVAEDGHVMIKAKGSTSYHSLPFTLPLLAIVLELGLIELGEPHSTLKG